MLGGVSSGGMHCRGRISVIPAGHDSPAWMVTAFPRPPPRPPCRPPPAGGFCAIAAWLMTMALRDATMSVLRMNAPDGGELNGRPRGRVGRMALRRRRYARGRYG